ncbi:MAG: ATP-grasp domain-containing protein [Erysipelotrichales bacterium]|nr:ATP-grasp domain-containing protein [Erysipelotrichales bacterium]
MERIVIIGANSFQNRLILKTKELGYETHVFAWQCGDVGEKTADHFYPISITEKEEILKVCREIQPAAVCSVASDLAVLTVNYVARNLGLPCNSARCDVIATNKFEMRNALEAAGVRTPRHIKVYGTDFDRSKLDRLNFPIIVKPTDRSGSRAIYELFSKDGLEEAVKDAVGQSFEKAAIIEEYIEGNEYSCECISYHGKHHFLALTEKHTTGAPHYIETGHVEPANISPEICEKIRQTVFKALDALEISDSASHAEFKLDSKGNVGIIEIGARMGGDCIGSDLVYLSTGNDFLRMVIDVARGKEPELVKEPEQQVAAIRFIMNTKDLEILERAKKQFRMEFVSDIEKVDHAVVDSSTRLGYFIVTTKDYGKVEEVLFGNNK